MYTPCGISAQAHLAATEKQEKAQTVEAAKRRTTKRQLNQHVQEFQSFYQDNLGQIYRYIYSKIGNREEAEDLTSQIFLKAVHGVDYERGPQSMQKWLFQVARTTIADYWRTYYRIPSTSLDELLDAGWEGPTEDDTIVASPTATGTVTHILQAIPEHYREVLNCRFLLNLSIKETALRMGLTEANVKVLQFRALKRAAEFKPAVTEHMQVPRSNA